MVKKVCWDRPYEQLKAAMSAYQAMSPSLPYLPEQVFNNIAKDPSGSPSSTGNWPMEHGVNISIYNEKVNLQASLAALSDSLEVSNGLTPYGDVVFGINR